MCSKFSRKCLSSATDELYINIITFIRQTELCEASHNSVTVNVVHALGLRLKAAHEALTAATGAGMEAAV